MKYSIVLFITFLSYSIFSQIKVGNELSGYIAEERFGEDISISDDGKIIAVASPYYSSNDKIQVGKVSVYKYENDSWIKLGGDILGDAQADFFGSSIDLSSDGSVLAIGAPFGDKTANRSGYVRIFRFLNDVWIKLGDDISGTNNLDKLGISVSLNNEGDEIAIGANQDHYFETNYGYVGVYKFDGNNWKLKGDFITGNIRKDQFGYSVKINSEANIVAISAIGESYNGYIRVFEHYIDKFNNDKWRQLGSDIKGNENFEYLGGTFCMSDNGKKIALNKVYYDSQGFYKRDIRLFEFNTKEWDQIGSDIETENKFTSFGDEVSFNNDGTILAIGLPQQNLVNNSATGEVKIYKLIDNNYLQIGNTIKGKEQASLFGFSINLNNEGNYIAIGSPLDNMSGNNSGKAEVFNLSTVLSTNSTKLSNTSIFPNPATDVININTNNETFKEVLIYNSLGQIVKKSNQIKVDTSNLDKGVYFITIETEQGKSTKKLIIN